MAVVAALAAGALSACGLIVGFGDLTPPDARKVTPPDGASESGSDAAGGGDASDATLARPDAATDAGHDGHRPADATPDVGSDSARDAASDTHTCSTMCGGATVCLDTDPSNCGACGNVCDSRGASPLCAAGSCSLVTLVPATGPSTALAVSATSVYWSNVGGLQTVSLDGGSPTQLATVTSEHLAVDSTGVYGEKSNGLVWRVSLADGGAVTLGSAPSIGAGGLALDSTNVYLTGGANIYVRPKDGDASIVPLGPTSDASLGVATPTAPVVSDGQLYWGVSGDFDYLGLNTEALDGGGYATLVGTTVYGLGLANGSVYFTADSIDSGAPIIARYDLDSGVVRTLAQSGSFTSSIVVDGAYVYWVNDSSVVGAPVTGLPAGSLPVTLFAGGGITVNEPGSLRQTATAVYWIDPNAGTVMRAKKLNAP